MFIRGVCRAIFLSISLTGCSGYPLPQQTTGYDTLHIVANIRCQARDAIRSSAIYYFEQYTAKVTRDGLTGPEFARQLNENPNLFETYTVDRLAGDAKDSFSFYKNSQIAYEFSLRGFESNTQGLDLSLERNFGRRIDTLGFKNEALRSRDVTRSFFAWDKLENLIKVNNDYCNLGKRINVVYPSTGRLPFYDLIYSYVEANILNILVDKSNKNNPAIVGTEDAPAIPAMGDTIIFKTQLTANMSPSFDYNPAGVGLLVSSLALKDENVREDTHTLTITISTAPDTSKRGKGFGPLGNSSASDSARLAAAQESVAAQRQIRLQNAVINLSNSLSRIAQ